MLCLRTACLCVLLSWLFTACGAASPTLPAKIQLQACAAGNIRAQCGTLAVFGDRAAQSGRKIDLKVAVIPAESKVPAPDPIFVLAGGPGTSAIE